MTKNYDPVILAFVALASMVTVFDAPEEKRHELIFKKYIFLSREFWEHLKTVSAFYMLASVAWMIPPVRWAWKIFYTIFSTG
jgi:hypothetical protein